MTFLSKLFLISFIFNLLQLIKPLNEVAYWDIEGDIECREDIEGFGEFSFLLQDVVIHFKEKDLLNPDDHLGSTKTDRNGHFHFKPDREYDEWSLEPYFIIEHICYTPSVEGILRMGCHYETRIDFQARPEKKYIHIYLGKEGFEFTYIKDRLTKEGSQLIKNETRLKCK